MYMIDDPERAATTMDRVQACLRRISACDARVNAFITVMEAEALRAAKAADLRRESRSILSEIDGLVIAVKDCIDVAQVRCTHGSIAFTHNVPSRDAPAIGQLKRSGAVIIGKTNLHEFAFGGTTQNEHYGACRNPWDLHRIPGGSSGGSAAAVAAGFCDAAIGTDTGASIRVPAALNGVAGLRPTCGRISNAGVLPVSPPHDTVGILAYSVDLIAKVLKVLESAGDKPGGAEPQDLSCDLRGLRILVPGGWDQGTAPAIVEATRDTLDTFRKLGAIVFEACLDGLESAQQHLKTIIFADAAAFHEERLRARPELFGSAVRERLELGLASTAVDYARSLRWLKVWRERVDELFSSSTDLIATPSTSVLAPRAGDAADVVRVGMTLSRFAWPWAAARIPALSLPCGFSGDGLPIGLQIAARAGDEAILLRAGRAFQSSTDWHKRRPKLACQMPACSKATIL
jgi:aspartyl-tRNA(Asn)/glutamyl-tRNA(Gln) amidotransferase subunit A